MVNTLHKIGFWGLVLCYLIWLFYPVFFTTNSQLLVLNMSNEETLPKNFRLASDSYKKNSSISREGLNSLNISGSGQFSENSLKEVLKKIPLKNVTVVDLREESHGYVDGMAVSWYASPHNWGNLGKSLEQILSTEKIRLEDLNLETFAYAYKSRKIPILIWVRNTNTERALTDQLQIEYERIPVADHRKPNDHEVDQFIEFMKKRPKTMWLHFHCAEGIGRTTTFMVMTDMIYNAKTLSLNDLIERQALIGGVNLFALPSAIDWKFPYEIERDIFLGEFYQYCHENPDLNVSWSDWKKNHQ